jgi:hypothetical protein
MKASTRDLPKTDKGLQAYPSNIRPPPCRECLALGGGLNIFLEPSGVKTFQARIRRQGDKAARRIRIGGFPTISIAEARNKLAAGGLIPSFKKGLLLALLAKSL